MRVSLWIAVVAPLLLSAQSAVREVKSEVDGSEKYVQLTCNGKGQGAEQNEVKLPYAQTFYAKPGAHLYLSAQKTVVVRDTIFGRERVADGSGTVHVLIRVTGSVLQEAESSAPYGVATASGIVPD